MNINPRKDHQLCLALCFNHQCTEDGSFYQWCLNSRLSTWECVSRSHYTNTDTLVPRIVAFIEIEIVWWFPGAPGGENEELVFHGYRMSAEEFNESGDGWWT